MAVSVLIMALTGSIVLIVAIWKGRSFVAQWHEFKVTVNPKTMDEFSKKMDEVVKSVNNKLPSEPTLFETVKLHTKQLTAVNQRLSKIDSKLDNKIESLQQVSSKLDAVMHHVGLQEHPKQGDNT